MNSTEQRIIHPTIDDDGSVYYESVMTPSSDTRPAICPMIPDRIVPVIFVPGIMGSNLKVLNSSDPVWTMNSEVGAFWDWVIKDKSAAKRKQLLDPLKTDVDDRGDLPTGTALSKEEMGRRGWGEVSAMSYGAFLAWLESHLNDIHAGTDYGRKGLRAELMTKAISASVDVPPLTHEEVATSYRYQFPVHAVGYNWLQSNAKSAERLRDCIETCKNHYREQGKMCDHVIIVTHSMGGLVARHYSEVLDKSEDGGNGYGKNVLGIVHGVMPATGAAAAYKRVKAGTEGLAGPVLGANAERVTAVFAQAPGALQLLPSNDYGMGWLKVQGSQRTISLPWKDVYDEIYLQREPWWGLINDQLINPLDPKKKMIEQDWNKFALLITEDVKTFHEKISRKYHRNTYAFYGDDPAKKTWGAVTWRHQPHMSSSVLRSGTSAPLEAAMSAGHAQLDNGIGSVALGVPSTRGESDMMFFAISGPDESGDSTVPVRSGKAPAGERGVQFCIPFTGCEHEGAFKDSPGPERQRFTLWAVTKIAYEIRHTTMAYHP